MNKEDIKNSNKINRFNDNVNIGDNKIDVLLKNVSYIMNPGIALALKWTKSNLERKHQKEISSINFISVSNDGKRLFRI